MQGRLVEWGRDSSIPTVREGVQPAQALAAKVHRVRFASTRAHHIHMTEGAPSAAPTAPDATPSAAPCVAPEAAASEISQLLDLPSDLLQQVLTQLINDELSLLRMGATCKMLKELASAADLWRPALCRFFDGEVPPALATCADPQREPREQVLCAQRLVAKEREARSFQVADVDFPNSRAWIQGLDDRVAEAQMKRGDGHARPGRPYYGCDRRPPSVSPSPRPHRRSGPRRRRRCSGGAYNCTTLAYGKYVKGVMRNGAASRYGISADEARLTVWVRAHADERPEETDTEAVAADKATAETADVRGPHKEAAAARTTHTALSDCDYGPMAEWKDRKLAELAATAGHAQLAARYEEERLAAVRAGILYPVPGSSYEDVNIGQAKWPPCPDALSRPKLLAGLYGGLFGLEECYTSIGTIYALECPADGSNIVDYSGM